MSASDSTIESLAKHVRPLNEADLPEVLEIERTGYSFPWPEAVFKDCFRSNYRLWAVEYSGVVAGYAVVAYMFDEAHLLNLCVSTQHRRSGLARHLLRYLLHESAKDGMTQLLLEVRMSNQGAADLYVSEGFAEIGRRPDYYPGASGREDARVLSISLPVARG